MLSSSVMRPGRAALVALAAGCAAASALAAVPSARAAGTPPASHSSSHASTSTPRSRASRTVTLLTGDRVSVGRNSSGRVLTSLTPGSPDAGEPLQTVRTPGHAWVFPRLAPAVRRKLDPALFDVAALARNPRVTLRVTFARGVSPRGLPGLKLAGHDVRRLGHGATSVLATYDARRPLPSSLLTSLAGVRSIALARADGVATASGYQLHTMTIDATDAHGASLPAASVFLVNTDHVRLFGSFGVIVDGQWKVSVPQGHYLAFVNDYAFHYALVGQATIADSDAEIAVTVADATARPTARSPRGFHRFFSDLEVLGFDRRHRQAQYGIGFVNARPKLTPVPASAGSVATEVATTWTPRGFGPKSDHPVQRVVMAKVMRPGIPRSLSLPYRAKRFADVSFDHYATGSGRRPQTTTMYALDPRDNGVTAAQLPTVRPGVLRARLLGGKNLGWFVSSDSAEGRNFVGMQSLAKYHRGEHVVVPFFRGPLAPFADRGWHTPDVFGPDQCPICVVDGALTGFAPIMSSAGTAVVGDSITGRFALFRGRRRLAHGIDAIRPDVTHVKPGEHLRLVSRSTPPAPSFTLSSRVHGVWRFSVPKGGNAMVPLLRAAYVPPTDLHSVGPSGRVTYPVTFDNVGPVDARVTKAMVSWSTDGQAWHAARLVRLDKNTFRISYRNPLATPTRTYVDLEVAARDAAGRTVSETVTHAYLLPRSHRDAFGRGNVCGRPTRHRYACFAQLRSERHAVGRAPSKPTGWGATALRDAYAMDSAPQTPSTIAVIDAFGYPHAEADMNHYRAQYGLPACTTASGCFRKVNQKGQEGSYPKPDASWGFETALDLQMVSAACPTCHIILVEANRPSDAAFERSERTAVRAGATVTSHSFGRMELTGDPSLAPNYEHPGVTAVVSTGDGGYSPANFPASSPDVIAVGGTVLSHPASDPVAWTQEVWSGASSGCSALFDKPTGQPGSACRGRAVADISAVASGLAVYDTSVPKGYRGWAQADGTSASAPLIAAMIASVGGDGLRPDQLYAAAPGGFTDVVGGSNGFCRRSYLCTGVPGYDGPTGLGSPSSPEAFAPPT